MVLFDVTSLLLFRTAITNPSEVLSPVRLPFFHTIRERGPVQKACEGRDTNGKQHDGSWRNPALRDICHEEQPRAGEVDGLPREGGEILRIESQTFTPSYYSFYNSNTSGCSRPEGEVALCKRRVELSYNG